MSQIMQTTNLHSPEKSRWWSAKWELIICPMPGLFYIFSPIQATVPLTSPNVEEDCRHAEKNTRLDVFLGYRLRRLKKKVPDFVFARGKDAKEKIKLPLLEKNPQLARPSIWKLASGAIVPLETLSGELQRLHEEKCLELEVLQGNVLSDHVVRKRQDTFFFKGKNNVYKGGLRRGGLTPALAPRVIVITEVVWYVVKNRCCKHDSTAKGYIETKSCLNEEKENTGNRCNEPHQQILPSGTRRRTAAASSSSCSNSSIATHYRGAAVEVHGRCIQIHTRTSSSSVQYN